MTKEKLEKIPRYLSRILPSSKHSRLVLVTGARQTGKTTLIQDSYPRLPYFNLDAPENRETIQAVSSFSWGKDIGNAVFDEAQKAPAIFEKVKFAFDGKAVSFSVFTGSSQILLLKKVRESLAGRISLFELWPLMFCELASPRETSRVKPPLLEFFVKSKNVGKVCETIPGIIHGQKNDDLNRVLQHLIQWGGMPALLRLSPEERWKWLKDYEYTYLQRDLADLSRLNDLQPFHAFQRLAALRTACLLNFSQLARDSGISVDTARRYLEYLRLSYQVFLMPPYYRNLTSSVVKTPKLYWLDTGVCRNLTGNRGEATGELFESLAVAEIYKWIKTVGSNVEMFYYRTHSGAELDVLCQTEQGLLGMEIKKTKRIGQSDLRVMKEVGKALGNSWLGGLVIYSGNKIEQIAEPNIWAMPVIRLFMPH